MLRHISGYVSFLGYHDVVFSKKQLKMKKFPIKNLNFAQNPLWKFWVNFGHFWLKMTSQKAQIHQNWPLKKFFSEVILTFYNQQNLDIDLVYKFWMSISCWKDPWMSFVNDCAVLEFVNFRIFQPMRPSRAKIT